MKVIDASCTVTWWAMALFLIASLGAFALRPETRTFYGTETGMCDAGCSDQR